MADTTKKTADTAGKDLPAPRRRGNPLSFFVEVRRETSKVTWPAWKEVWITTAMVLVMVTLTAVFFLITDMIIGNVVNFVLRLGQ